MVGCVASNGCSDLGVRDCWKAIGVYTTEDVLCGEVVGAVDVTLAVVLMDGDENTVLPPRGIVAPSPS
jgi:hypothetical protein